MPDDRKPQADRKHPGEWQQDLNPERMAGQNIGLPSAEPTVPVERTAFHLRKRGRELGGLADDDLKRIPLMPEGSRLQQGATYVNLAGDRTREITATGDTPVGPDDAYVPKDRVPYDVWNRLIGEPKPGQE